MEEYIYDSLGELIPEDELDLYNDSEKFNVRGMSINDTNEYVFDEDGEYVGSEFGMYNIDDDMKPDNLSEDVSEVEETGGINEDDYDEEGIFVYDSTGSYVGAEEGTHDEDGFTREDYYNEDSDSDDYSETDEDDDLPEDELPEDELAKKDGRDLLRKEMESALASSSSLSSEYESTFSEEERISTILNIKSDSFSLELGTIRLEDIAPTVPLKESRKGTYKGLTQTVKELGILTPIHVMYSESFKTFLEEGNKEQDWDREEDGNKYILIDGFRRVWAGITNRIETTSAVIWDFKDTDLAMDLLVPLSLLLNRNQKRNWKEVWGLYELLESTSLMTPSILEYLLQLEPGEAMKLKDVVLCEYPEVVDELFSETKTLTQCYNNLQKLRKEENRLEKDDQRGITEIEGADGVVGDATEGAEQRSYEEVKRLIDFSDGDDEEMSDEDFIELAGAEDEGVVIDRRKGEDIPRELKQAALVRDNYTCQASGYGSNKNLPLTLVLSVLQVHHIIPLYLGGKNTLSNLITLRMDIHTNVHVLERLGGKVGMSKEQFDELDPELRKEMKVCLKLAKFIVDEAKRQGKSIVDRELQNASRKAAAFKMPGTDLKENMDALKDYSPSKVDNEDTEE